MSKETEIINPSAQDVRFLTFKEIMFKYISNLPLFFFSLGVSLIVAWSYLRWATPVYSVYSSMIIKNETPSSVKSNEKFSSIFEPPDKINLQDEVELIKSKEFLVKTVENLGLNNYYVEHGSVRSSEVYNSVPYRVEPVKLADSTRGYKLDIQFLSGRTFLLGKESKPRLIYSNIEKDGSVFRLVHSNPGDNSIAGKKFTYRWVPSKEMAGQISGGLAVTPVSAKSSVLNFSYQTYNTEKGLDILNQIMSDYDAYSMQEKGRISINSLGFINDRLMKIERELSDVEGGLRGYMKANQFIDMQKQSDYYFSKINVTDDNLRAQEVQLKVLGLLDDYISDKQHSFSLTPTNLGITDPTLNYLITEYNRLIIKRESDLRVSRSNSPVIVSIEQEIEKTRTSILENLRNIRSAYNLSKNELERQKGMMRSEMFNLPEKEGEIREIKRQQMIKKDL